MFGLPADVATVDRLVSDSEAWQRSGGLGVPLDVNEPEVVRARAAAMPETAAIPQRAESILGDRFGGTWADTTRGENVVASISPPTQEEAERITSGTTRPVRFSQVEFSLVELRDAEQSFTAEPHSRDDHDLRVVEVSVYPMENRLRVAISTSASEAEMSNEAVADRFTAERDLPVGLLVVNRAPAAAAEESAPLGGHYLTNSCSVGLHAYAGSRTASNSYLVTAGHCTNSARHRSGGTPSGTIHDPIYRVQSSSHDVDYLGVDAQLMRSDTASQMQPTAVIESWHLGQDFVRSGTVSENGTFDQIGHVVCHAGAETGGVGNCGSIKSLGNCLDNILVRKVEYSSTFGDSGATVYGFIYGSYSVPLAGLHTGNCSTGSGDFTKGYTFQSYVISTFGLTGWW